MAETPRDEPLVEAVVGCCFSPDEARREIGARTSLQDLVLIEAVRSAAATAAAVASTLAVREPPTPVFEGGRVPENEWRLASARRCSKAASDAALAVIDAYRAADSALTREPPAVGASNR